MKARTAPLSLLILVFVLPTTLRAQTWSAEQQEVWTAVEELWEHYTTGNIDPWYDLLSDDYRGWGRDDPVPLTKDQTRPWNEVWAADNRIVVYHLFPLAIEMYGDVAITFYTYRTLSRSSTGEEVEEDGRWMDVYRKVGGQWLLIADSGGAITEPDEGG